MPSSTDDSEYLHERAATARALMSRTRDSIIRSALADIAASYEALAKRAEQFRSFAKPTRLLLWPLLALSWLIGFAEAAASL